MRILIILLLSLSCGYSATIPDKFYRAIHMVETGGRLGAIYGDNGRSLGPFQISKAYWIDAKQYNPKIGGVYSDCAKYSYAKRVVEAYMRRYAPRSIKAGRLDLMARIHNGGPQGWSWKSTLPYWRKVEKELAKLK